ncbi:hypothetical protein ACGF0J_25285 [Nonomuraea sp. NPDC047897]|uniref:hypothetical protein n=1 Tax=Nonomuraea sp. NPDC047897 TaxID=3364346 RepID=UPI003712A812
MPPQGPPPTPLPTPPSLLPPTLPSALPGTPSGPRKRRGWVLPVAAAAVVLAIAGAAGAYLVSGRTPAGTGTVAKPPASVPATPVQGPDVCAMLSDATTDRLVPGATVSGTSRDTEYTVNFDCNWTNRRISFGDYWRSREVDVKVRQHKGQGAKTGRSMAQNSYEVGYSGAKFRATAKPSAKSSAEPGDKDYTSPVTDIPGVGDGAFAQYVWRRSGTVLWYSYGEAHARVGDMTIEVKYQASQQRKDAAVLTNKTTQSVSEENAVREVTALVGEAAKGVTAWKARHPGVLAVPRGQVSSSPTAQPTSSPRVVAFPPACKAVEPVASRLVPNPTPRARAGGAGGDAQTECRWLNLDAPAGDDVTRIRSVLITTHRFTNRAGAPDVGAARGYFAKERGGDTGMEGGALGGITWGKVIDLKDLGEAAYGHYIKYRRMDVHSGSASVVMRRGAVVVSVDYSGAERPKGEPANSPKVRLMPEKEARAGALTVARAYLAELAKEPTGG